MGYFYNNMYASTIAIIKYDSSGNLLWQRSFGEGTYSSGTATVTGVKTDAAGNIYICGSTASFGPNYDSYYLGNTSGRYRSPTYDDDPDFVYCKNSCRWITDRKLWWSALQLLYRTHRDYPTRFQTASILHKHIYGSLQT